MVVIIVWGRSQFVKEDIVVRFGSMISLGRHVLSVHIASCMLSFLRWATFNVSHMAQETTLSALGCPCCRFPVASDKRRRGATREGGERESDRERQREKERSAAILALSGRLQECECLSHLAMH